uniref:MSP domain-containing protein n=1 Tax=Panagrolaimus sp. ES5 TaxID=591445 RepID=A0AC34GHA2_9BILA
MPEIDMPFLFFIHSFLCHSAFDAFSSLSSLFIFINNFQLLKMTDFGLKLEPSERVVIANKKLGEEPAHTTLKINNDGKDRCAFKVKCTSNELFRIRPPLGILRNGDSTSVA